MLGVIVIVLDAMLTIEEAVLVTISIDVNPWLLGNILILLMKIQS